MQPEELCERLRQNELLALEAAIDRYTSYLISVARELSSGALTSEDLEEIAADTFLRLWDHRAQLDPTRSLKWYLVQTTRRLTIDRLRKNRLICLPLLDGILQNGEPLQSRLEQKELLARLAQYLTELDEPDRELLIRFYEKGQQTKEIAARMGLRPGTVRTRLTRLRASLRRNLEREELV